MAPNFIQKLVVLVFVGIFIFNGTFSVHGGQTRFHFFETAHADELQCPLAQMGMAVGAARLGLTMGDVMGLIHCAEKVAGGAKDAVVEMYNGGKACITAPWKCTKDAAKSFGHKALIVGKIASDCGQTIPVECIQGALEIGQAAIDKTKQIASALSMLVEKIKSDPSMMGKSMQIILNMACSILGRILVSAGVATVMALATAGVGALVSLIADVASQIPIILRIIDLVGTGLKYADWIFNFPGKISEKVMERLVEVFAKLTKLGHLDRMDGFLKVCHLPVH